MFIRRGSHVEIIAGGCAGCFGIVRDFLMDEAGECLVFVEFWHGYSGKFLRHFFKGSELKRRKVSPILREQIELAALEV